MNKNLIKFLHRNRESVAILIILVFFNSITLNVLSVQGDSVVRDYWPTDEWQTKTFEEVDMNEQKIDELLSYIDNNNIDIESILIVKDGYLVLEEYLLEDTAETRQNVRSVTKSFMSSLIGIAIEEGYIESVDQKMFDFLYNASLPNIEQKENITIYHLLTMTSGITWYEFEDPLGSEKNITQMIASDNWVEYVLSCEMDSEPGTTFCYNTGGSHLLSAILEEATGNSSLEYATKHIFDPLGISNISWAQDPQGIYFGGSWLEILPRDMAKFGYLFFNNGSWDETQIISKDWLKDATSTIVEVDSDYSYGYQWWYKTTENYYSAAGNYIQLITVIQENDMVVVITGDEEVNNPLEYTLFIDTFIAPAAEVGYTPITETSMTFFVTTSILILSITRKHRKRN